MSHAHTHASGDAPEARLRVPTPIRHGLVAGVVLLAVVVGAALVWLWPRGPVSVRSAAAGVQQESITATVVAVSRTTCTGTPSDRSANGSPAPTVACASVQVRLGEGPERGKVVRVDVAGPTVNGGLEPGVGAVVTRFPADTVGAADDVYAWVDFDRQAPMLLLFVLFVLVVLAVARLRGIAALVGVGVGFVMVLVFLLPALRRGEDPVAVTLVGSVAVMLVVLYASHGVSAKTTTALFGTVFALAVTGLLARWASSAAHLDGQTGEDAMALTQLAGAGTVRAVVVSGMVLAGLGVLNDVTVTQASAVWELKAAAPHLGVRALFSRGMRIGRDHLSSTVYTIAFAYAGVSLPVLLLIQVYERPLGEVVTSAPIAQEVVGVLVGGIGLALAIPLTTLVAALVAASSRPAPARERHEGPEMPAPRRARRRPDGDRDQDGALGETADA